MLNFGKLNFDSGAREVFAKVQYSTEPRGKTWIEVGTYRGKISELDLLEDTVAAIEAEIERLKAK